MKQFCRRTEVTAGLIVGAILTTAIAGTMDIFLPLGPGGWGEAVRKTILTYFGHPWEEVLALRIIVGLLALVFVMALGALTGALFALLISGFFRKMFEFLDKHEE